MSSERPSSVSKNELLGDDAFSAMQEAQARLHLEGRKTGSSQPQPEGDSVEERDQQQLAEVRDRLEQYTVPSTQSVSERSLETPTSTHQEKPIENATESDGEKARSLAEKFIPKYLLDFGSMYKSDNPYIVENLAGKLASERLTTPDKIMAGTGIPLAAGVTIASFELGGGVVATISSLGAGSLFFALPAVAAATDGYFLYKGARNILRERTFKKAFGKSVDDARVKK